MEYHPSFEGGMRRILHARAPARDRARNWFLDPELRTVSARYDERETALSRSLCLEVGVALFGRRPRRLLDVGCGTGALLARAKVTCPEAKLVGVDPARSAVQKARRRLGAQVHLQTCAAEDIRESPAGGRFDLVLAHLSLALWHDPLRGLTALAGSLEPGGICYILDLLRPPPGSGADVPASMGAQDGPEQSYLRDQLAASLSLDEMRELATEVARTTQTRAEVRRGGLGGHPPDSREASRIWRSAPRIADVLAAPEAARSGSRQIDSVAHLVLRRA